MDAKVFHTTMMDEVLEEKHSTARSVRTRAWRRMLVAWQPTGGFLAIISEVLVIREEDIICCVTRSLSSVDIEHMRDVIKRGTNMSMNKWLFGRRCMRMM